MNQIDTNLYDRQIRTYGEDALKKIVSSSVTIIGLENGLGTEIAKNLALGGVKEINLFDNTHISQDNLETGFYYSEDDIGKIRSQVLANKVRELNPYVTVNSIDKLSDSTDSILIFVNQMPSYVAEFTGRMVAVFSKGVAGVVFVNAGENHIVTDIMGENIEPVQIGSIDITGKVLCAPQNVHEFQSGDYIKFDNLQGDNVDRLLNKEFKIQTINPQSFKLVEEFDFSNIKLTNGTVILVRKPVSISHQPFSTQFKNPSFNFTFDDSEKIFKSLMTYFTTNMFNNPWSNEYESQLNKYFPDSKDLARTFACDFLPVYSLMGSVVASETIKLITNKYMPVNQFWCWNEPKLMITKKPTSFTTTSIGKLYGEEFEKELAKSSWFLVGSGAIGCELLKNLAYLGVSSEGMLYLTDPDNIEKSNLNRQFLFRNHHIGKPKSKMAADVISGMRPINITALTEKVCKENQLFTDKIMKNITGVFNALDNIHARRYMDEQCFHKQLPLFESGTTGTKGNTQPVIPFVTETYSNSADPPQEKSFPICTIKNFPNEIQHTIHWAMDYFELFNRAPQNINKWIKNRDVFNNGVSVENNQGKEDVYNFLVKMNIKTFDDCVYRAIDLFYKEYKHNIEQLLTTYPPNHMIDESTLFWSNGKRMPTPFNELDINNSYHVDFIEATAHLLSRVYNLNDTFSRDYVINLVKNYKYTDTFKINPDMKIATKDSEISKVESNKEIELPDNTTYQNMILCAQEFEKDDSSNWHVSFVTATSNLRALNYNIPPASYQETKGIAGRIIPAIATTTSVVSGLIVLEMLKYMLEKNKLINTSIENFRSTFVNLADTTLVYSEPLKAGEIDIAGVKFNNWTKFELKEDCTLEKFKQHFETLFKTSISMIVYDNSMLFADFMNDEEQNRKLMSTLILDSKPEANLSDSVILSIASSDDDVTLPEIHFTIQQKNYNYL